MPGSQVLGVQPGPVVPGRGGSQPAAAAPHHLVHDQHPGAGVVLAHDVPGEDCALLGRGRGAERLLDREDVVVDRLGQADDHQRVALASEEGGQVRCRGVGVVPADGVQDVDAVLGEPIGGHLQRVLTLGDQPAPDKVFDVGQLHPGIADRGAAELVQDASAGAHLRGDGDYVAGQQSLVSVAVGDDLDVRRDLGVALDQPADGR